MMNPAELLRARLQEAIDVCESLMADDGLAATVERVAGVMASSLRDGGKVMLCGNGGSSADAQHLAAEFIGRFLLERRPYPAIALSDNVAAVTAIANDYGYRDVFSRAVIGLGRAGDVLIGFSTSGRSENVIDALVAAREIGIVTVGFVGAPGSAMEEAADYVLRVEGPGTARIQEGHMILGHTVFELVERELCRD